MWAFWESGTPIWTFPLSCSSNRLLIRYIILLNRWYCASFHICFSWPCAGTISSCERHSNAVLNNTDIVSTALKQLRIPEIGQRNGDKVEMMSDPLWGEPIEL